MVTENTIDLELIDRNIHTVKIHNKIHKTNFKSIIYDYKTKKFFI